MEEQKKMAKDSNRVAGKGKEEFALDEFRCKEQLCIFAGTKLCVEESCNGCKLNHCRVCRHLFECFERVKQE